MSMAGRRAVRPRADHKDAAARAKDCPGEWVHVGNYASTYSATDIARRIEGAHDQLPAYEPGGAFQTETQLAEFDTELWVKYVGADAEAVSAS